MSVKLDAQHLSGFMNSGELEAIGPQIKLAHELLHSKSGPGSDFLGWLDCPASTIRKNYHAFSLQRRKSVRIPMFLLSSASAVLTLALELRLSF